MFKLNQYAAVNLRLIHYQHARKGNNSIPFSFLTVIPYIHIDRPTDDFKMNTDSTRKAFRYWIIFFFLFFQRNASWQVWRDERNVSIFSRLNERCQNTWSVLQAPNVPKGSWVLGTRRCPSSLQPTASPSLLQGLLSREWHRKWRHRGNKVVPWYFMTLKKVKLQLWRAHNWRVVEQAWL